MYTYEELKSNRDLWRGLEIVPIRCDWCQDQFEIRYGTLYNVIRREADGIYCSRKCSGLARSFSTQQKYKEAGGKTCKRCGEFKSLDLFSSLPNPPYLRAECKRCHNYKPARQYSSTKEKYQRSGVNFTLSLDQYLTFRNSQCHYCGSNLDSIRLEMLNVNQGYILENVVPICFSCQKFKNGLGHQNFVEQCHKISNHLDRNKNE